MNFTAEQKEVIVTVLEKLYKMPYNQLSTFLDSKTIKEMKWIYSRIEYAKWLAQREEAEV